MPDARRQFRVLYKHFLLRLVDLEVLSAGGNTSRLFVNFAALLGAFSFVMGLYLVHDYAFSSLPRAVLARAAMGDQEFLIGTTIAVVGLFGIIAWDAVFPDRRDSSSSACCPCGLRRCSARK